MRAALGAVLTAVVLAGCGVGVTSLEDFRSAVRSGANCAELWDQRSNFTDAETLEQIDAGLAGIGCDSADSERSDA